MSARAATRDDTLTVAARATLLYDGTCRLCRFAARLVVRLDRDETLAFLPFGDPAAAELLDRIPESEQRTSWHLLFPDGGRASRGQGAVELFAALRLTRRVAPLLRVLPLDPVYDLVAGNRGRIGRLTPRGAAPRRFP